MSPASPQRVIRGLPQYLREHARADAVAGLTVAVMGVPQAMAYAIIADLPPVYGLYTAIVTCIVAAVLGSSNHLVTGPTNALCMVILSLSAPLIAEHGTNPLELALLLTFLTGVIQLAFGLLRLGGLVRYVSNSVVVGFTAGAGILIAANQIKNILGLDLGGVHTERFYDVVMATVRHIPDTNPRALVLGVSCALAVVFVPRLHRRLPGSLVGIVLTGLLAWALGWHRPEMGELKIDIVRDIQPIKANLLEMFRIPHLLAAPDFALVRDLSSGALALAILGLIEAASIARAVASSSGQRLDATREFLGQGAGNLVGSFFSCFAGSGSFTRTAVCYASGGSTRMAAVFSALWTALTVLLLAPFANFIPKAALAGILVVIAYSMIDKHRLRLTWRTGTKSRLVLFGTLASTLIFPLHYAIFIGVFLSIVILLQVTGKTDLTQLVPRPDSGFDEVPFNRAAPSPVVSINMEGDLYFAAVEDLDHELFQSLTARTRVVVLRMKRLRAVGSTAMAILEHFEELLRKRGIRLVICGIEDELARVMTGSGLREQIGELNIFYADNRLLQSTELAHARAWSIVETEDRERGAAPDVEAQLSHRGIIAADIVTPDCIRFGNQHQIREAVWLMSEMQKRLGVTAFPSLFLQNKEGKLYGELSVWRLMRGMKGDVDAATFADADDLVVRSLLRQRFADPIRELARTDLPRLAAETPLEELLDTFLREDLDVLPVSDEDGRITGLIRPEDLLRGLDRALGVTGDGEGGDG